MPSPWGQSTTSGSSEVETTHGISVREVGDHREAPTTDRDAVAVLRELAVAGPLRCTADLARSLNSLGQSLSEVSEDREAVTIQWLPKNSVARPRRPREGQIESRQAIGQAIRASLEDREV